MEDFTEALNSALLEKDIWEGVPALSPVSLCVKSANATTIRIRWHGHVFKDMLISVDVVPALFFSNFWPPNVSKTALLTPKIKENGIHVTGFLKAKKSTFAFHFLLLKLRYSNPFQSKFAGVTFLQRQSGIHMYVHKLHPKQRCRHLHTHFLKCKWNV